MHIVECKNRIECKKSQTNKQISDTVALVHCFFYLVLGAMKYGEYKKTQKVTIQTCVQPFKTQAVAIRDQAAWNLKMKDISLDQI